MKRILSIIFILALVFSLSACKKEEGKNEIDTIKVTDPNGREVDVKPGSYKKIICIGAGALRLYSYVGDIDKLVAVEDIDNYTLETRPKMFDQAARPYFLAFKEDFKNLASCGVGGPNAQAAEEEKILACDPDLIISEYEDVDKANTLQSKIGVPVITLKYGKQGVFDNYVKESISLLGKVLGKEEKALELNNFIASEKTLIQERVKDIDVSTQKKVYICGLGNWGTTNYLFTAQNYEPFNVAKINNVVSGLPANGIQSIDEEKLASIAEDIEVLIIDAAAIKNISDTTSLQATTAWKNEEVYLQMAYNAYYTNLEIALINTWFNAKVVYPEIFEDIDIVAKTNEVTTKFLGKNLASEIFEMKVSFGGYQKIDLNTFFK